MAAARLPQAHCLITTPAGNGPSIGAKSHRTDGVGMALQDVEALAAAHFPQAHRSIFASADKGSSIGAEGYCPDPI